jgi:hypothetical protein
MLDYRANHQFVRLAMVIKSSKQKLIGLFHNAPSSSKNPSHGLFYFMLCALVIWMEGSGAHKVS